MLKCITRAIIGVALVVVGFGACTLFADKPMPEEFPSIIEESLIADWESAEPLNNTQVAEDNAEGDWASFEAAEPLENTAELTDNWIVAEEEAEVTEAPATPEVSDEVAGLFWWGDDESDKEETKDYVNGHDETDPSSADKEEFTDYLEQDGWFAIEEEEAAQEKTVQVPEELIPEDEAFAIDGPAVDEISPEEPVAQPQKFELPEEVEKVAADPALDADEYYAQGDEEPLLRRSASGNPLPSREEIIERLEKMRKERAPPLLDENGDYRLRVGDTVRVSIYGEGNTERTLTIDAHGEISYLLVGRIQAAGFTVDELRRILNEEMKKHLRFGLVNVVPVEFGGLSYTILGQVRDPGKKGIMGKTYLLDAIASANGFAVGFFRSQTQDLADLHHAFVARQGEYIPVDFWRLVVQGDLSQNIEIKDGDYIFVPSSLIRNIYVIGEVRLPANIGYLNRETLAGALAKARGVTRNASRYAYVVRGSLSNPKAIRVNLDDLQHGRIRDIVLQPNDIVYVPRRSTLFVEDVIYAALRSFTSGFFNVAGRETFIELEPDAADSDFGGSVFFP